VGIENAGQIPYADGLLNIKEAISMLKSVDKDRLMLWIFSIDNIADLTHQGT
jgi:hypothetical protein